MKKSTRRRGRPRAFEPEQVLERALAMFWERSFADVSLDQLAAASGVARPSLAGAFGNKEALFVAALQHFASSMSQRARAAAATAPNLKARLLSIYHVALDTYTREHGSGRGCFAVCVAASAAVQSDLIREAFETILQDVESDYDSLFQFAQSTGEISKSADTKMLAKMAAAFQYRLAIGARAGESREILEQSLSAAVEWICTAPSDTKNKSSSGIEN